MADFSALIAQIEAYVKQNGNNEITGNGLQSILVGMVNALGTVAITALQGDLADEVTARTNADGAINAKIPAEASSSNKLADKAFVTGLTTALQNAVNAINANIENGYVYAGIAIPSGTPVSGKVFYLARQAGTYTNFGALMLTEGVNVLKYNGTAWSQEQLISIADIYKNPLIGYYECDTAGGTAAKTVTAAGYVLPATGGSVKIKMANRNMAANATLNINSTGAKPLYYNGQRAGVGNTWDTNEIVEVFYDGTNYQAYNVAGSNGDGVFDISAYNLTDGQPTPYVDLAAALGTNGEHVPQSLRKGGMSIKFIQGNAQSSDNKYVQFRLMKDEWSITVTDWQGVDDEVIGDSPNLVKNGAVVYGIDGAYITGLSPYAAGRAQKQLEVNTVKAGKHYFLVSEVPSEWSNATVGLRLVKAMTLNSSDLIVKVFDYITGSACLNNIYEVTLTQEQASQVVGVIFSSDNTDTGAIGKTINIKWWDESGRLYFEDSTKKDLAGVHKSLNEITGEIEILSFSGNSRLTRAAYDFQNGKKYKLHIKDFVYSGYETFNISLLSNPSWNTANRVQNVATNITEGGYFYFECNVSNAHYIAIRGNENPEESYSISFDAEVYEAVHSEFYVNNVELMIKRNIFSISHQGFSTSMSTGKCIASNYIDSARYGFDCGECDVQWTSDNVPVCCHDDSFTDSVTGDVISISGHTYTELLTYSYYGTKISSLEDVIKACKVAGIEIQLDKVHYSWTDTQYEIIFGLLKKYGMASKTTWYYIYDGISSFAQKILTFEPCSKLYFPVTISDTSKIETINGLVNDKNTVLVGNSTTNLSVSDIVSLRALLDSRIKIGVGTIDAPSTFRSYLEVVDCITSNKISESLYRVNYMQ